MRFTPFLSLFLPMALCATPWLSELKEENIRLLKEKNTLESEVLEFNWINPIVASWSKTTSEQLGSPQKTALWAITVEQPIFKSGGIYFALHYASAHRRFLELSTQIEEKSLFKEAFNALLLWKMDGLKLQKQTLLIDNARLDVMRKQEQYDKGLIDSSFLDQALLTLNAQEKIFLDLKAHQRTQQMRFKAISDEAIETLNPPPLVWMDEKRFVERSLAIAQQRLLVESAKFAHSLTLSSYLPTVSLSAGYYHSDRDMVTHKENEYMTYGVKVSMPLFDINRANTIEIKHLEWLKAKVGMEDTQRAEALFIDNTREQLALIAQKKELSKRDAMQYASLVASANEGLKAGDQTMYDVQTLQNSHRAIVLDEAILDLEEQLLLLELFAKVDDAF